MQPHRRQPTRLLWPWDSPGKNTGVGCHCLLQCMKVKRKLLSHVGLFATPWTAAYQVPSSVGFSRQDFPAGVGCHCLLWVNLTRSSLFQWVHNRWCGLQDSEWLYFCLFLQFRPTAPSLLFGLVTFTFAHPWSCCTWCYLCMEKKWRHKGLGFYGNLYFDYWWISSV